jgi:hypothetical protein
MCGKLLGRDAVINLRFRALVVGLLIVVAASAGAWAGRTARERAAEAAAFKVVYDTAVLEHRDPDAAVRKARYITDAMSGDLDRDRGEMAEEVARFLVLHGRRLCGGGLR